MLAARIELLQQMPIFGGISEETLEFLLGPAPIVDVPTGEFFFQEGDPPHGMFVLEAGRVTIFKSWQGRSLLLHQLKQGDCFGEMSLLDLSPRSASVRADAACVAVVLTPANLYRLYEHNTAQFALIQMNIGRELSRRLRVVDDLLLRARMGEVLPPPKHL
ncbi:Crp/Fnr family transcriptional regulator [Variovorax sp. dw_308]|uniref:Crp/Fnr family transcriptional regulator n=1 Tax=Variovorax sp. dw_308 TaxID=2721546 RepID=UPI001C439A1A|nr:cyclic nucleotide-binding domain-containing protein [Variovorax sp. dw_308]